MISKPQFPSLLFIFLVSSSCGSGDKETTDKHEVGPAKTPAVVVTKSQIAPAATTPLATSPVVSSIVANQEEKETDDTSKITEIQTAYLRSLYNTDKEKANKLVSKRIFIVAGKVDSKQVIGDKTLIHLEDNVDCFINNTSEMLAFSVGDRLYIKGKVKYFLGSNGINVQDAELTKVEKLTPVDPATLPKISAHELAIAFENNKFSASKKYINSQYVISGIVRTIGSRGIDPIIYLEDNMTCYFTSINADDAAIVGKLKAGDKINIVGKINEQHNMKDCAVVAEKDLPRDTTGPSGSGNENNIPTIDLSKDQHENLEKYMDKKCTVIGTVNDKPYNGLILNSAPKGWYSCIFDMNNQDNKNFISRLKVNDKISITGTVKVGQLIDCSITSLVYVADTSKADAEQAEKDKKWERAAAASRGSLTKMASADGIDANDEPDPTDPIDKAKMRGYRVGSKLEAFKKMALQLVQDAAQAQQSNDMIGLREIKDKIDRMNHESNVIQSGEMVYVKGISQAERDAYIQGVKDGAVGRKPKIQSPISVDGPNKELEAINSDFDKDIETAGKKYRGHSCEIIGTVSSIKALGDKKCLLVNLKGSAKVIIVQCEMRDKDEVEKIIKLLNGDPVVISGTVDDYIGGRIYFAKCIVVPPNK